MAFLRVALRKDFRRRLGDPAGILLWIGIPLLIGGLMSLAMGGLGSERSPRAHLLVADLDHSPVSGFLVGALGQDRVADFLRTESVSEAEGRTRMAAGEASGLLVIPEGFGAAFLEGTPSTLELLTNPAESILPRILRGMLETAVDAAFYVQQFFGDLLQGLSADSVHGSDSFTDAKVAGLAMNVNQRIRQLGDWLFPPVIQLHTEVLDGTGDEGNPPSFGARMLPGVLFMMLLFVAQGISEELWRERELGTLARTLAAPVGTSEFLLAKILHGGCWSLLLSALGLLLGVALFGFSLARLPLAILWAGVVGAVLTAFFLLLQTLSGSRRGASILGTVLVFPLMMLGGAFFPFSVMPGWMAAVGRLTPNGAGLLVFQGLLTPDSSSSFSVSSVLVLLLCGLLATWLTRHRLRRGFALG